MVEVDTTPDMEEVDTNTTLELHVTVMVMGIGSYSTDMDPEVDTHTANNLLITETRMHMDCRRSAQLIRSLLHQSSLQPRLH